MLQEPLSSHWQAILGKRVCVEPPYDLENPTESQSLFIVHEVTAADVSLEKLSNQQYVRVPLFALSRPWGKETEGGLRATITHGALRFVQNAQRWRWMPQGVALQPVEQTPPQLRRRVPIQAGGGRFPTSSSQRCYQTCDPRLERSGGRQTNKGQTRWCGRRRQLRRPSFFGRADRSTARVLSVLPSSLYHVGRAARDDRTRGKRERTGHSRRGPT